MSGFPIAARFAHPDWGYPADQKLAAEHHLEPGKVYLLSCLVVGRSSSEVYLWDLPGVAFNTVLFEAAEWPEFGEEPIDTAEVTR
jgi:hypothetical protein